MIATGEYWTYVVGYAAIAFNVTAPLSSYDASTIGNYVPCYNQLPVFPDLDSRTADTSKGQKTCLQLSRLTVVLDEKSISGGKGNGICFVSGFVLSFKALVSFPFPDSAALLCYV